ncbi:MAG: cell division protein ZapA [Oscillospiraceae bacterium]|nr:cell division protein ZapA [Oscillospiraceae bacterium]
MDDQTTVRLSICGLDYMLLTAKDEGYMQALGQQLQATMNQMMQHNSRLSATQAAVLCALRAMDEAFDAQTDAENLRERIGEYLDDATQARREATMLQSEIADLKRQKK